MRAKIRKSHRKLLGALSVAALTLAALVPAARAASGEFAFAPGAFAKAHAPLTQETPGLCELSQCTILDFLEPEWPKEWIEPIEEAPEPTQAGGHPDFTTHFRFAQTGTPPAEFYLGAGNPKTIITDAPAGAIGNPLSVVRCAQAQFNLTIFGSCPPESQVGGAVTVANLGTDAYFYSALASLIPSPGEPGQLGFKSAVYTAILHPEVRSDGDYGLRINADDIPIPGHATYIGNTITIWGVPHDPIHDAYRFNDSGTLGDHIEDTPRPFLSAPTNCSTGPITLTQKMSPWQHPGLWAENSSTAAEPTGCDQVPFEPAIAAHPSTNVADSPTGLEVDVSTPQHEGCEVIPALEDKLEEFLARGGTLRDEISQKRLQVRFLKLFGAGAAEIEAAEEELRELREELQELGGEPFYDCGLATSHLKDTTLTLPAGLAINPSGANGLVACSPEQIGLTTPVGVSPQHFTKEVPHCPEASRIGSVEVDTPLLDAPAPGSVYIAKPYDNPFGSFLAIYIAVSDVERGFVAKLAGKVNIDPVSGQLSTTVTDAPQLPFSHFLLHFKQGPHATLRTPGCGQYTTTAALTPYSQPTTPFDRQEDWAITQGPAAGCEMPNAPVIDAGSVTPLAGAPTPTVVNLSRPDGTQEFSKVSLTLPPGLTGKLAGISQCPDGALAAAEAKTGQEELASPSCPANSRIGSVYVAAGSGPDPYNTKASAYLTAPYKGAPASIAIVAPATAGPFDLGTVVVRVALRIDQNSGQITATSDEIPHILKGIPLDIRSTKLIMDRPDFTRNGTNCDPSAFSGSETSTLAVSAPLSERFQLAECSSLGFKPKLSIRLFGSTTRGGHPALRGTVKMPEGGANIASASVALPHSEFLDQGHIGTVCTRVQFAQGDGNGSACPPGSVYGKAVGKSPLVDYALQGPAILRSSSHKLPDLVVALHGPAYQPVKVDVVGRIDSANGGIRTTFEGIPDLPVSSFVLNMKGGKKGLLQNSTDVCEGTHRATGTFVGQNAKTAALAPELRNSKCGKSRKAKHHGHKRSGR
jgi:hypothetical protein